LTLNEILGGEGKGSSFTVKIPMRRHPPIPHNMSVTATLDRSRPSVVSLSEPISLFSPVISSVISVSRPMHCLSPSGRMIPSSTGTEVQQRPMQMNRSVKITEIPTMPATARCSQKKNVCLRPTKNESEEYYPRTAEVQTPVRTVKTQRLDDLVFLIFVLLCLDFITPFVVIKFKFELVTEL
jgi:hypothetical protein